MSNRRPSLESALLGAALLLAGCDGGPTHPDSTAPQAPSAVVRLELVAPQEIATGQSVQLRAMAHRTNGSVEDVTQQAEWTVQSGVGSPVIAVTPTGLATATNNGQGRVTARFAGSTDEKTILVVPAGTFRLSGMVSAGQVGLQGVTVTVVSGIPAGLRTETDVNGEYAFYGVVGPLLLDLRKEGYVDRTEPVQVVAHAVHSFEMKRRSPTTAFAGTYTLTVIADDPSPPCTPAPQAARRRVYVAHVEQAETRVTVELTGAELSRRLFAGSVTGPGQITFSLRPTGFWDYGTPDVLERLPDGTSIMVLGEITAGATTEGIVGNGGWIQEVRGTRFWWCSITSFEMVRR